MKFLIMVVLGVTVFSLNTFADSLSVEEADRLYSMRAEDMDNAKQAAGYV